MTTDTRNTILAYITQHGKARVHDLVIALGLSNVAVHKQIKKLLERGEIEKIGTSPLVFYRIAVGSVCEPQEIVGSEVKNVINDTYLYISPRGELVEGWNGFAKWADGIGQRDAIVSLAKEYCTTRTRADLERQDGGLIDATKKFGSMFSHMNIDRVYYQDFYALPKFGKTKLGQYVLYAKQSQNRKEIVKLAYSAKPLVEALVSQFKIDAVGFIPPTIPRKVQFLKEFERGLSLPLPRVSLVKAYPGKLLVAQKTLSTLAERVTNARDTIFVKNPNTRFNNILLIDDAVGSGATMNEVALKLKESGMITGSIIGFGLVGSFKGFDVIREV